MKSNPAIKTFLSAAIILLIMLFLTGLLTYLIPNGVFDAQTMTFTENSTRGIPILTLIGAPILVLFSESGPLVIAIIIFLLIIGGAIHTLKEMGLIEGTIISIVKRFENNEYKLLALLIFVFMSLGAFIGVFASVYTTLFVFLYLRVRKLNKNQAKKAITTDKVLPQKAYLFFIVMMVLMFLLVPILMPILAFQFGDGFSNVLYPTNAVLLIALGLSKVSDGKWLKFIIPLQLQRLQ